MDPQIQPKKGSKQMILTRNKANGTKNCLHLKKKADRLLIMGKIYLFSKIKLLK